MLLVSPGPGFTLLSSLSTSSLEPATIALNPHRHRRMNHQVGVLLPMLLASSYCANLFTESCNSLIGESFAICATFMQRLRQF